MDDHKGCAYEEGLFLEEEEQIQKQNSINFKKETNDNGF